MGEVVIIDRSRELTEENRYYTEHIIWLEQMRDTLMKGYGNRDSYDSDQNREAITRKIARLKSRRTINNRLINNLK